MSSLSVSTLMFLTCRRILCAAFRYCSTWMHGISYAGWSNLCQHETLRLCQHHNHPVYDWSTCVCFIRMDICSAKATECVSHHLYWSPLCCVSLAVQICIRRLESFLYLNAWNIICRARVRSYVGTSNSTYNFDLLVELGIPHPGSNSTSLRLSFQSFRIVGEVCHLKRSRSSFRTCFKWSTSSQSSRLDWKKQLRWFNFNCRVHRHRWLRRIIRETKTLLHNLDDLWLSVNDTLLGTV